MDLSNRMPVLVSSEGFPFSWAAGLFAAFLCPIHRVFRFSSGLSLCEWIICMASICLFL